MSLEVLEKGIVISKEGGLRKFNLFANILEGELVLKFTSNGTKSEFKIGKEVMVCREGVSLSKTLKQTQIEAVLVHIYYDILLSCKKRNPWERF
ncbi:MAG TPA: hypothetical protein VMW82_00545 [Candidatus Paceibacterota bacterium]|nr:hypothetical protein [Candidatus Paceibacterota bacterium]